MMTLLKDKVEAEREPIIAAVASRTAGFSTPAMLAGGRFSFPQEAYVATARSSR
jgi:hypothetical protein